jgi:hypothetical protein
VTGYNFTWGNGTDPGGLGDDFFGESLSHS